MLSKMAIEDLAELEKDGIRVSPRDAILLNEAGCEVEKDNLKKGCPVRRIARIGDHLFSEMTILQSQRLLHALDAMHVSEFTTKASELALTAALRLWFSEVVDEERQPTLESLDGAIGLFVEISGKITPDSLLDVLRWLGRCETAREGSERDEEEGEGEDVLLGLTLNGSEVLGLSLEETRSLTTFQLVWALRRKQKDAFDNAAFVRYTRILEGIRNGEDRT